MREAGMSDKVKGFVVSLDYDMGEEHAVFIKQCIMQIKGVVAVEPRLVNYDDHMNRQRIKHELFQKMMDVFR